MSTIIGGGSIGRRGFSFDGGGSASRLDAEPSLDEQQQAGEVEVGNVQAQLAEVEDDAGDMMAQFGRFRASDRKARRSDDFERILDSDAEEKLDDLDALFKDGKGGKSDLSTLMSEARQRFQDSSDLMLAFRELRRKRRLEGEDVDTVERAMEDLLNSGEEKQVKAGINAALKAKVFGARMQLDPRKLRHLYRQFLEFEGSYLIVYEDWIEQFGAKKRKRILEYVRSALTYDMQSLDPSCRCAAEFGPLLGTLNQARILSSADELFVGRILDDALAHDCGMTEDRVLAMMLGGLQRPLEIAAVLLEAVGDVLKPLAAARRSQLLQLVLRSFTSVPITLFGEPTARHVLVEAIEEMIGTVYARERRQALRRASGG
ncbi:type III secretion system gatekeeper subunit SctW [Burkholderia pyrrocinia]